MVPKWYTPTCHGMVGHGDGAGPMWTWKETVYSVTLWQIVCKMQWDVVFQSFTLISASTILCLCSFIISYANLFEWFLSLNYTTIEQNFYSEFFIF